VTSEELVTCKAVISSGQVEERSRLEATMIR
jgi:hypothetical protein